MDTLVHLGLLNAALATLLALLAAAARCLRRRPALVHALWLLVLLKLLTPPFLAIPIAWLPYSEPRPTTQAATMHSAVGPFEEETRRESVGSTPIEAVKVLPSEILTDEIPVPPVQAAAPAVDLPALW